MTTLATNQPDGPNRPSNLIDINAVAEWLGVQVRHVRRLVTERRIPFLKWGGLLRFDPDEIAQWLESVRVPVDDDHPRR